MIFSPRSVNCRQRMRRSVPCGDALDQPGPLQAVGDLRHGAERNAQFAAEADIGRGPPHRMLHTRSCASGNSIAGSFSAGHQLPHQIGQQRGQRLGLLRMPLRCMGGTRGTGLLGWRCCRVAEPANWPVHSHHLIYINHLRRSKFRHWHAGRISFAEKGQYQREWAAFSLAQAFYAWVESGPQARTPGLGKNAAACAVKLPMPHRYGLASDLMGGLGSAGEEPVVERHVGCRRRRWALAARLWAPPGGVGGPTSAGPAAGAAVPDESPSRHPTPGTRRSAPGRSGRGPGPAGPAA